MSCSRYEELEDDLAALVCVAKNQEEALAAWQLWHRQVKAVIAELFKEDVRLVH